MNADSLSRCTFMDTQIEKCTPYHAYEYTHTVSFKVRQRNAKHNSVKYHVSLLHLVTSYLIGLGPHLQFLFFTKKSKMD